MVEFLAVTIFAGALALSIGVIALAIGPNALRIVDTLFGRGAYPSPLSELVQAERRIAVRRWAAASAPRSASLRMRAAA